MEAGWDGFTSPPGRFSFSQLMNGTSSTRRGSRIRLNRQGVVLAYTLTGPLATPPFFTLRPGPANVFNDFRSRYDRALLGHDTLLTTEIYLNLSPEHVVEEFQQKW